MTDANGDEQLERPAPCAVEFAVNDGITNGPNDGIKVAAPACWSAANDAPDSNRNCYSLSTIEFDDSGRLSAPLQVEQLAHHIRRLKAELQVRYTSRTSSAPKDERVAADRPGLYIVAYVHGWRNDARPGNSDFRKLRVLASSAARDLAARCRLEQRYCNTAVVGLFLGWRGSVGLWDSGEAKGLAATLGPVLNGLTFAERKLVSDRIGPDVIRQLIRVRADAGQVFDGPVATGFSNVKMLLVGHSLGGNLVLSGVPDGPIKDERLGLPSDLAVIINPATETSKWVSLWHRVNAMPWGTKTLPRLMFLMSPPNYFTEPTEDYKKRIRAQATKRWGDAARAWLFPRSKSDPINDVTTANTLAQDRRIQADIEYDSVVDSAFRRNQLFSFWPSSGCDYDMNVYGLGHLPFDESNCKQEDIGRIFTHYVEVNYSQNTVVTPATYNAAANASRSCFVEPAFLYCARSRQGAFDKRCGNALPAAPGTAWDFAALNKVSLGLVRDSSVNLGTLKTKVPVGAPAECLAVNPNSKTEPSHLRFNQQINVQIGTGRYAGSSRDLGETFSPLWGVRVFPNALIGHSGFWTTPFECMFNKLVLDDPLGIEHPLELKPDAFRRTVSAVEFVKTLKPQCAALYALQ